MGSMIGETEVVEESKSIPLLIYKMRGVIVIAEQKRADVAKCRRIQNVSRFTLAQLLCYLTLGRLAQIAA